MKTYSFIVNTYQQDLNLYHIFQLKKGMLTDFYILDLFGYSGGVEESS